MYENSAAFAARTRADVIIKHDDAIVEPVVAPQRLGARPVGISDFAIIVAVRWRIAPALPGLDSFERQCSLDARKMPRAEIAVEKPVAAAGRGPVSFAFSGADTAAAKRAGPPEWAKFDPAAAILRRNPSHDELRLFHRPDC